MTSATASFINDLEARLRALGDLFVAAARAEEASRRRQIERFASTLPARLREAEVNPFERQRVLREANLVMQRMTLAQRAEINALLNGGAK